MDELIRYIPVLRRIGGHESVLEIGSGLTGLGTYVRRPIHAIDPLFGESPPRTRIVGVGADFFENGLPDASYDLVVAVDFLEHVSPALRTRALDEMIRIARRSVIVGFPCGEDARALDQRWHDEFRARGETPPDWLAEHIANGIPQPEEVLRHLRERGFRFTTEWNAGLRFHAFFARAAHTKGVRKLKRFLERVAAKAYPLVDLVSNLDRRRYRLFVFVDTTGRS